jgi:hypothetical protein
MIFLIEYERDKGRILRIESFHDCDRRTAEESRLQLELALNLKRINHEVVFLEAESEEAVRRTHRRYFESLSELATSPCPS